MTGRIVLFAGCITRFEERFENVWSIKFADSDAAIDNFEYELVLTTIFWVYFVVAADADTIAVLWKLEGVWNQV